MKIKKIDLGEYIIDIKYDEITGNLDVSVLDELGELVESILIRTDDDDDDSDSIPTNVDFNLN